MLPDAIGMDGLPVGRYEGRLSLCSDLDDEASAFVACLMRERGIESYADAAALIIERGLISLGL